MPEYLSYMRKIEKALPEARFIHMSRDGYDVVLSILSQSFGSDSVVTTAERWEDRIERGRLQAKRLNHYLEVRYEDLVLDSEPTLHAVCEFCQLTWNPEMLAYYERAEERLREHAHDLPAKGSRPIRSADERVATHTLARQPLTRRPSAAGDQRRPKPTGLPSRRWLGSCWPGWVRGGEGGWRRSSRLGLRWAGQARVCQRLSPTRSNR